MNSMNGASVSDFDSAILEQSLHATRRRLETRAHPRSRGCHAIHVFGVQAGRTRTVPQAGAANHIMVPSDLAASTRNHSALFIGRLRRLMASRCASRVVPLVESPDDSRLSHVGVGSGCALRGSGRRLRRPLRLPRVPPSARDTRFRMFAVGGIGGIDVLMRPSTGCWRAVCAALDWWESQPRTTRLHFTRKIAQWGLHTRQTAHGAMADVREVCVAPNLHTARDRRLACAVASRASAAAGIDRDRAPRGSFVSDAVVVWLCPAGRCRPRGRTISCTRCRSPRRLASARLRVIQGFTESHVKQALKAAYRSQLANHQA